ncbi:Kelch motif/Galactose oxidase [Trypanosoma brucei equiperdum]|uniref:Kelch motif/Galactose oxidase n=1 Tax=Trypanosoma brucei equiperdum TaxID=630700 RepID=A0A3L6KVG7_9TRYP|nr:Kelch motif/Galactose oxidase [Trypanosoma brucei equiperdum]
MPPKRSKPGDVAVDKRPPGLLDATVQLASSVNAPSGMRIGHISFIHPANGHLCVVGGCDVSSLPKALTLPHEDKSALTMPFLESWNTEEQMWIAQRDEEEEEAQRLHESADKDSVGEGSESAGSSDSQSPVETCATFPSNGLQDLTWPTLAGIALQWKTQHEEPAVKNPPVIQPAGTLMELIERNKRDPKKEKAEDRESAEAPHAASARASAKAPVVLFVGGWKDSKYAHRSKSIDLGTGSVAYIKSLPSSPVMASSCSTATVVKNLVYVFGGNNSAGCTSSMEKADLTTNRWIERGVSTKNETGGSKPHPRSSHVAGLLLERYIVVYGGRQARVNTETSHGKAKKASKVDPRASIVIPSMEFEFCNDVAVYDVENEKWVVTSAVVNNMGPAPRYGHAACVLSPCELFVHGGIGAGGQILSDAWIIQLEEDAHGVALSWVKIRTSDTNEVHTPSRCLHSLAVGKGRRVYVTGGLSPGEDVVDVCMIDVKGLADVVPGQPVGRKGERLPTSAKRTASKLK